MSATDVRREGADACDVFPRPLDAGLNGVAYALR